MPTEPLIPDAIFDGPLPRHLAAPAMYPEAAPLASVAQQMLDRKSVV